MIWFIGAVALASAMRCCCYKASPAQPDGCLSAAEEMLVKVWLPASTAAGSWLRCCILGLVTILQTAQHNASVTKAAGCIVLASPPGAFLPKT